MIRSLAILRWNGSKWRRLLVAIVLIAYISAGSIVAVGSGVTVDDPLEQFTFHKIVHAARGLLTGHIDQYKELQSYGDRYYGIGFDTFAYPFQLALGDYLARASHIDRDAAWQVATRPAILVLFGVSIVVFYRCLRFFNPQPSFALAMTGWYAANPYLFGHAMINVRDSPFMSIYLVCTYLSLKLARLGPDRASKFRRYIIMLAAATAALTSIRIPGLMILVQYAFTFFLADACGVTQPARRLIDWKNAGFFFAVLIPLVVLSFPAVWLNPLREIGAGLSFVGWYYQSGCTLTWGQCIPAYASLQYVLGWFAAKLPLLIMIGIGLIPLAARKVWKDPFQRTAYLTLIFGTFYVLIVIIPLRAHLYDETRQLLFLYPLLFLSALVALYTMARRIAFAAVCLSLGLFVWDQIQLNPYQYVYFNEVSRFFDVDRLFETDYWGISAREHARQLAPKVRSLVNPDCFYADPVWLYRPFLASDVCAEPMESLAPPLPAHGFIAAVTCSPNRSAVPPACEPISAVTRSLPLSNRTMRLSAAYYCRPK
ncbi:MAG TPA: hypothetical protein VH170_08945 [Chthoniobacterales bacterium]|nr:hypothetical protein [Chthoniobacterales bacterium]